MYPNHLKTMRQQGLQQQMQQAPENAKKPRANFIQNDEDADRKIISDRDGLKISSFLYKISKNLGGNFFWQKEKINLVLVVSDASIALFLSSSFSTSTL